MADYQQIYSPVSKEVYSRLMNIEQYNLDSLRKLVRDQQKENTALKAQLAKAGLPFDVTNIFAEKITDNEEYDLDQGSRINSRYIDEDIRRVTKCFADAAGRAKKAGFEGVEIHAAHGYLLSQFYSPLSNHRKDEYTGETLEGRLRFHKKVIEAVREEGGADGRTSDVNYVNVNELSQDFSFI